MQKEAFSSDLITNIKLPVLKILFKYVPVKTLLLIIARSKAYQKPFSLNMSSYSIFSHLSQRKYNLINIKTFSEVFEKTIYKLQCDYTLSEIAMGFGLYLLHLMNVNNIKRIPVYLNQPHLFIIYLQLAQFFNYKFNIIIHPLNNDVIEYCDQIKAFVNENLHWFQVLTLENVQNQHHESPSKSIIKVEEFLKIIQGKINKIIFLHWKFTSQENALLNMINTQCHVITKCDLSYNTISNQSFNIITKLDINQRLRSLHFKSSKLYKLNIETLSSVFLYKNLLSLNLSNNKVGDEGMVYLTNGHFYSLEKLVLFNSKITKEGIHHFLNSTMLNLQYLNLEKNDLSGSASDLFKSPFIKLTFLNITDCNMKDKDFLSIEEVTLIKLSKLLIGKNIHLGLHCLEFTLRKIQTLEYLAFTHTSITSDDIGKISSITNESIRNMILSQNKNITSQGIIDLLSKNDYPNIELLDLFNNDIDNTLIDYLIKEKSGKIKYINVDLDARISTDKKKECYEHFKKYNKVK